MKIKGLYQSSLVNHWVVQLPNNKFYIFRETPFRTICEKDLEREVFGNLSEHMTLKYLKPAPQYMLKCYGLEICLNIK